MKLPPSQRRMSCGCEEDEEDAMTLLYGAGAGAGRSMSSSSSSMYHHNIIAAGEQADDVLNLYGNNGAATEYQHLCRRHGHQQPRSSRRSSHVDDTAAVDAVLVARDNQEVVRQNAERNAEAAREHAEAAMASRVVVAAEVAAARRRRRWHDADNDAGGAAAAGAGAARAHAEIAHLMAEGVAEMGRLREELSQRGDEAVAGIITSSTATILAPILMAALLYYIVLPLALSS